MGLRYGSGKLSAGVTVMPFASMYPGFIVITSLLLNCGLYQSTFLVMVFLHSTFLIINKKYKCMKKNPAFHKILSSAVKDELPKSAWLVSKMGRLTVGVQYEPQRKFTHIIFVLQKFNAYHINLMMSC